MRRRIAAVCRDEDKSDPADGVCTGPADEHLFYCQDANFNVTALVDGSDGGVVERYVYDHYGKVSFYDGSWNARGSSAYDNAVLFCGYTYDHPTGLYHVRHRSYHPALGRWTQRDPGPGSAMRIGAGGGAPVAGYIPMDQYADGMNLYQYVRSSPAGRVDPTGLWASNVHRDRTIQWSRDDNGMATWAARVVGHADNGVDPWLLILWLFNLSDDELSWHFDIPAGLLKWGPTDSRYVHAEEELKKAIGICQNAEASDEEIRSALRRLGRALHPVQDWVAHGDWNPALHWAGNVRAHPGGSDDWGKDFTLSTDGILRDKGINFEYKESHFAAGTQRQDITKKRTVEYLDRFKASLDREGKCWCEIYDSFDFDWGPGGPPLPSFP